MSRNEHIAPSLCLSILSTLAWRVQVNWVARQKYQKMQEEGFTPPDEQDVVTAQRESVSRGSTNTATAGTNAS